jgi:putative ABC transport system permease protein
MAGGRHGLRAAVRIARRDAARSRGRTALVAAMIGLPVMVCVAGGTLITSSVPTDATYARTTLGPVAQALVPDRQRPGVVQDARHLVGTTSDGVPLSTADLDLTGYAAALADAVPTGDRLVPVTAERGAVVDDAGHRTAAGVTEYPADELARLTSAVVVSGRLPERPGEVAVSRPTARDADLRVGDVTNLEVPTVSPENQEDPTERASARVTVVGVVVTRNPLFYAEDVVAPAGTVLPPVPEAPVSGWGAGLGDSGVQRGWYVLGPTPLHWSDVRALNALGSTAVSRYVVLHPDTVGPEASEAFPQDGPAPETIALVAVVVAMVLLEVVLLVGPAFAVGGRRSQRQLALIAAVGGDRRALRRVMLAGGLVIGCGASLVAALLGVGIAALVRAIALARHSFVLPDFRLLWWVVPAAVLLGTLVAVAAAWVPARRASRVDVPAALAGRRAEARPRRAVPVVGAVLFVVGAAVAVAGASRSQGTLLVVGVVVLELGMVTASGGIVALAARLSRWAGVAGRFALRDAARQRGRTAPAVAAVIAAVAGLAAGAVFFQSQDAHDARQYAIPIAAGPTVLDLVGWPGPSGDAPPAVTPAEYDAAVSTLRSVLPVERAVPARVALPATAPDGLGGGVVSVVRAPRSQCPALDDDAWLAMSSADRRRHSADPRCVTATGSQVFWHDRLTSSEVVVDDGTLIRETGVGGAGAAAAALAAGKVVVGSPYDLWPDGSVHLSTGADDDPVVLPGYAAAGPGLWTGAPVLPPRAATALGLRVEPAGALVLTSRTPTAAEYDRAREALGAAGDGAGPSISQVQGGGRSSGLVLLVMLGGALLLGLASTGIAVALAAAESRPDLATLGAVGASPSVRRRVAAAQAGVIAVLGSWLGVVTGVALGHVLVVSHRFTNDYYNPYWSTHLPWPTLAAVTIGLPALAMGASAGLTRSRLPMVRRVVG